MATGFDIGTRGFRVARGDPGTPEISETAPLYVRVDDADLEGTDLSRSALSTVDVNGETYVVGSDATRAAAAVGDEPTHLLDRGALAAREGAGDAFAAVASAVLGDPADDERLAYSVPGTVLDADVPVEDHRETVREALADLGYDSTPVAAGFAVVYDELADANLTGLGVAVGAASTTVTLVYYGVPVLAFSIAKGSDWVAEQAAATTDDPLEAVLDVQAEATLDSSATDGVEGALVRGYDALVGDVVEATVAEAGEEDVREGVSVPVVVAGEGAVPGLGVLAAGRFDECGLDLRVTDAVLVDDPADSVARGALAAAAADVDAYESVTRGAESGFADGATLGVDADASTVERPPAGSSEDDDATGDDDAKRQVLADASPTPDAVGDASGGENAMAASDDAAITKLFDRLANRDEAVSTLRDRLEDVADRLAELSESAASTDRVEAVAADVESTRDSVADLDAALAALDDRLADVGTALDGVESRMADAETVGALGGDVDALEADIAAVEADLEAVDERSTGLEARADDLADGLASVETDVAAVESDLEAVAADAAEADELTALEETVAAVEDRLTECSDRLDDELDEEGVASDTVGDVRETVSTVRSDVDALEDRVDDLAADVAEAGETATEAHVTATEASEMAGDAKASVDDLPDSVAAASAVAALEERVAELEGREQGVGVRSALASAVGGGGVGAGALALATGGALVGAGALAVGALVLAGVWATER